MKNALAKKITLWAAGIFSTFSLIQFFVISWASKRTGAPLQVDAIDFFLKKLIALVVYSAVIYLFVSIFSKLKLRKQEAATKKSLG